ncbi:MAG: MATE family efflux transporter [Bifidobacteriaceae bacterium]|nr:MATE family efflux transporter [Bifidobacteriaceae bacterium]MCI1978499.1 MATE family efflux transporter [Bifidobacteriaceae bacterium]
MTQAPLRRLIVRMAIPAVIANVVSIIYNLTDTFFVGRLGTSASGALGIAFPIMVIIQATGLLFGQGSGNKLSIELGKKNISRARRLVSVGFFTALGVGALIGVVGLIFIRQLVGLFGATATIEPLALDYIRPLLFSAPFYCATFVLNPQMRYQGLAAYSMIGIISGAVLNIILEPIFIFVLGMGIFGAGLATAISQCVSFLMLLILHTKTGTVHLSLRNYKPDMLLLREMVGGGLPSLLRNGMLSVAVTFLNVAANPYGDAAIAAMAIVSRIITFTNTIMIGFGQGFQPVCGYNYGAGILSRVRKGYWFVVQASTVLLVVSSILQISFAPHLITIFRNDPQVVSYGALALRLQCCTLPLSGFIVMSNMMQQTIGRTLVSSIVGIARQGLGLVPALLILPPIFGFLGVQMAQPVADILALGITIPLQMRILRELQVAEKGKGTVRLPKK